MTQPDQHQVHLRDAVVRVFDASTDPVHGDASDMYVLEVFGMSVLIRLRATDHPQPEVYIHIDNESAELTTLAVEVSNGGDTWFTL